MLPVLMVGMQVLFANVGTNLFADAVSSPGHLAALAFGLAVATLGFSAFQTLNAEGPALWVLFCVPHSLENVLCAKAKFWAAVSATYAIVIFGIAVVAARDISLPFIGSAIIVLLGVPVFAT